MRPTQLASLIACLALGLAACQPNPTLTENGRLVSERTLSPDEALPTLFMPATQTPLIVPTDAPTQAATAPPATEVAGVPIATAQGEDAAPASPTTLPTTRPSKTPTVTQTQSPVPSITQTPTITVTPTASPTSLQFSFQGQQGQSSAEEATAYAISVRAAQQRAQAAAGNPAPAANPAFVAPAPQPAAAPGGNQPQTLRGTNCTGTNWFFSKFQPDTCPTSQTVTDDAAYVNFERGYMIWLRATGEIYVVYTTSGQPEWEKFSDTWNPGYAGCSESDRVYDPQRQAWEPKNGFCKVWRENGAVADRIGWALYNYEISYQPSYQPGEDGSLAIEDPDGSVFYLNANGTWDLWR